MVYISMPTYIGITYIRDEIGTKKWRYTIYA